MENYNILVRIVIEICIENLLENKSEKIIGKMRHEHILKRNVEEIQIREQSKQKEHSRKRDKIYKIRKT